MIDTARNGHDVFKYRGVLGSKNIVRGNGADVPAGKGIRHGCNYRRIGARHGQVAKFFQCDFFSVTRAR